MGVQVAGKGEATLRRTVAMLMALAVLAERTAGRSWPVRCLVLWLLFRAEAIAGGFVLDATGAPPPQHDPFERLSHGTDEALALARRLRMLASALAALLPDPCPRNDAPLRVRGSCAVPRAACRAAFMQAWYDTS